MTYEERFWSRVDIKGPNRCWIWQGFVRRHDNCGMFYGKRVYRIAYELTYGALPETVLHTCGVLLCCNPKHLYAGFSPRTKRRKGSRGNVQLGVLNPWAKLDDNKVREIRKLLGLGVTHKKIAEQFQIHASTVYSISSRQTWGHVGDEE